MKLKDHRDANENSSEDESEQSSSFSRRVNTKLSEKNKYTIEISWIHLSKNVATKYGGGMRKLAVSKDARYSDLLRISKDLFFPDGLSRKGPEKNFKFKILDFKQEKMCENMTVGEMYEKTKLGSRLRFYLSTDRVPWSSPDSDEDTFNSVHSMKTNSYEQQYVEQYDTDVDLTDEHPSENEHDKQEKHDSGEPENQCFEDEQQVSSVQEHCESEIEVATLTDSYICIDSDSGLSTVAIEEDHATLQMPLSTTSVSPAFIDEEEVTVRLHRVNILEEMVGHFKDPKILHCTLTFHFIDEMGADAQGVSRDAYSAFWSEFFEGAAEGEDVRVPLLSPKWKDEEWRAIGRILAKGFQDLGYFPTRLAPAFTEALIFGEHSVSSDQLFESLLMYLSHSERDLVLSALKNELSGDEKDELLDLMDRMGVKQIPSPGNLKKILFQVAHKQLIQKPKYALDYMSEGSGNILRQHLKSSLELTQIYSEKNPTTRKVLKLIDASPSTAAESQSLQFFRQYIRGQDEAGLRRLLRFLTGSDVLCISKINVIFTPLEGLARRPVAHTCGPVLELPQTYNSYPELRAEMESILSTKSSFIMDIA